MDYFEICVEEDEGIRLDSYIPKHIEDVSRSYISSLIKEGLILVNGQKKKPKYMVKKGDIIQIQLPKKETLEPVPEDIPLDIVYEDKDIIIVNKPKGMVVHPAPGNMNKTLVNALLHHTDSLSSINGPIRPGIVHRLDKDTSGLLIVAKNDIAHMNIAEQMKNHEIEKIYIAVVHGVLERDQATINAPIGRDPKNRIKMAVTNINSKEAITHYRVLERFNNYTYVELSLVTGRTHQIRVHMAYINHPVVGDPLYTKRKNEFGIDTQLLHAKKIRFKHPSSGEYMEFEAEPPEEFKKVIGLLRLRNR